MAAPVPVKPAHERFFVNANLFLDLLTIIVDRASKAGKTTLNTGMMAMAKMMLNSKDPKQLCGGFIEAAVPHSDEIRARNRDFFVSHASSLFAGYPPDIVQMLLDLFTAKYDNGTPIVGEDEWVLFWDRIHGMYRISINFVHDNSLPYSTGGQNYYGAQFMPQIPFIAEAAKWEMKLAYPIR